MYKGIKTTNVVIGIVSILIISLLAVNRWLMKQMDEPPNTSQEVRVSVPKASMPTSGSSRYGIPKIDPLNDPLTPVGKKMGPPKQAEKDPVNSSTNSEVIHEPPQESTILLQ